MTVTLLENRREARERDQSLENRVSALESYLALLVGSGDIANGAVNNVHIGEVLTVGNTAAKCTNALADQTSANAQDYSWITGVKPPSDADATQAALNLGAAIDYAKANGVTLIEGGYIRTGLVNASYINTGTLVVGRTEAKCTNASADQTSANTALDVSRIAGALGWQITSGYIKSYNGKIELKGSDTPHIKALYDASNYVQMTAASNVPRIDFINSGTMRMRIKGDGLYIYDANGSQKAQIYGSTTGSRGLYFNASYAFFSGKTEFADNLNIVRYKQIRFYGDPADENSYIKGCEDYIEFGSTETTSAGDFSVRPATSNKFYCGTSTQYWHRVYADSYWTKNTTFQTFDKYDDLQILRDLKFRNNKLVLKNLPKEIAENGFINFGGMASFNLCASRKIVECVDDLKNEIDLLKLKISKLEREVI